MTQTRSLTAGALLAWALVAPVHAEDTITFSWNGYEAEIPAHPQRVFVMDSRTGLEFALLAGYPVVATDWDETSHLPVDPATEKLSFRGEPSAELVLTYDPDLLVVGQGWWNYWQENGAFNGAGFNVLVIEDANNGAWKELMLGQLAALGQGEKGEAALAAYEAAAAEARPIIAETVSDAPVAISDIWGNGTYALHAETFDAAVARDIGINVLTSDAPVENGYQGHSAENVGVYADAALIVLNDFGNTPENPLWSRLRAVQEGKVYDLHLANSWGFALTATDFVQDLVGYARQAGALD